MTAPGNEEQTTHVSAHGKIQKTTSRCQVRLALKCQTQGLPRAFHQRPLLPWVWYQRAPSDLPLQEISTDGNVYRPPFHQWLLLLHLLLCLSPLQLYLRPSRPLFNLERAPYHGPCFSRLEACIKIQNLSNQYFLKMEHL